MTEPLPSPSIESSITAFYRASHRAGERGFSLLKFLLLLVVLFIIAAGAGAMWVRSDVNRPVAHPSAERIITIEPGTGAAAVVAKLSEAGIVRHPIPLRVYLRLTGRSGGLRAVVPISEAIHEPIGQ